METFAIIFGALASWLFLGLSSYFWSRSQTYLFVVLALWGVVGWFECINKLFPGAFISYENKTIGISVMLLNVVSLAAAWVTASFIGDKYFPYYGG